jgi:hypothetical protein
MCTTARLTLRLVFRFLALATVPSLLIYRYVLTKFSDDIRGKNARPTFVDRLSWPCGDGPGDPGNWRNKRSNSAGSKQTLGAVRVNNHSLESRPARPPAWLD